MHRVTERIYEELEHLEAEVAGVRHTYPGMLDWDRFRDIARDLLNAHARVDQAVRRFVTAAPTDDK
ncbi:MAG: hypothetical protein R6U37_00440 [Dehalococcoidia bacterium]